MDISIRHIGGGPNTPANMIELTIDCCGSKITEDITYLDGTVNKNLIKQLRDIADQLEEQNKLINP